MRVTSMFTILCKYLFLKVIIKAVIKLDKYPPA
ncbi:hypothetical protein ECOG_04391 [Escherichia coli H299]|nr:hypothetical protein ECOG_04391 [Escherichia coli H299]